MNLSDALPSRKESTEPLSQASVLLDAEMFSCLEVAQFRLRLRARQNCSLPEFLGSTLRGAFGHALKQAVCVMPHRNCERCLVQDRCLYPYLFETAAPDGSGMLEGQRSAPHPFILTPPWDHPSWGRTLPACSSPVLHDNGSAESPRSRTPWGRTPWGRALPACPSPLPHDISSAEPSRDRTLPGRAQPRTLLKAGDPITFDLTLIGRAIDYLLYIVFAVTEMARRGLGAARSPFELDSVTMLRPDGSEQEIYSGRTQRISTPPAPHSTLADWITAPWDRPRPAGSSCDPTHPEGVSWGRTHLACSSYVPDANGPRQRPAWPDNSLRPLGVSVCPGGESSLDSLRISFLTPTRIRIAGAPQSTPSFQLLVRSLLRRISMLSSVHGTHEFAVDYKRLIDLAGRVTTRASNLRWLDFERYSNRQHRKMKMGGFTGEVIYEAPGEMISQFRSLILAGEILHVGSGTGFGLGRYELKPPTSTSGRQE